MRPLKPQIEARLCRVYPPAGLYSIPTNTTTADSILLGTIRDKTVTFKLLDSGFRSSYPKYFFNFTAVEARKLRLLQTLNPK